MRRFIRWLKSLSTHDLESIRMEWNEPDLTLTGDDRYTDEDYRNDGSNDNTEPPARKPRGRVDD